jgi:hypothetical protein
VNTDCFAGVLKVGELDAKGQARTEAVTSLKGTPRNYATIRIRRSALSTGFFYFKGCNCGKKMKTGTFGTEEVPSDDPASKYSQI